jgi:hypothetical protein
MRESLRKTLDTFLDVVEIEVSAQGRYARHKLIVVVVWAALTLLTVFWSFSATAPLPNAIGADVAPQVVSTSGERWYAIRNGSGFDWSGVRVVLDDHYVFNLNEDVAAGDVARVFTKDFRYLLYTPRLPRATGAKPTTTASSPGPTAAANMRAASLRILTEQGTHTHQLE